MRVRYFAPSELGADSGMRVGVIGAGVAGLAAARTLSRANHEVVVFEKSAGFGGRCATRRVEDFIFDHGATSVAPRGRAIEQVILNELPKDELVKIEQPIFTHHMGRVTTSSSASSRIDRYCYRSGMNMLGKLLADGLDVRLSTMVETIEKVGSTYVFAGESFAALIVTAPIPQSELLLATLGETRNFANCHYRSVLSVMLGYDVPLETPYHALVDPDQSEPLTWLSIESVKCPGRAPEGQTTLVAQLSPSYSRWNYDGSEADIIANTVIDVGRILGPAFRMPVVSDLKRWRYSQPETTVSFESINRKGSKLLVASDGLIGGRIENAFDAGVQAAQWLTETA